MDVSLDASLGENSDAGEKLTALQVMQDAPVIPVIVLTDVNQAVLLARALVAGGIRMLEVTLRTPQALACIEAIARAVPAALVGAGTVRSVADVQAASRAGARFLVSPGYTHAVGQACRDVGLPLLPGVATGSEIMMAQAEQDWTSCRPCWQASCPTPTLPTRWIFRWSKSHPALPPFRAFPNSSTTTLWAQYMAAGTPHCLTRRWAAPYTP